VPLVEGDPPACGGASTTVAVAGRPGAGPASRATSGPSQGSSVCRASSPEALEELGIQLLFSSTSEVDNVVELGVVVADDEAE
jgi:hypothetical protein